MCLPKQHIQGSCLGVPPAAVLNKLFVLVRKSQHSRIQSSQQHTKIRKFAAVCPAPSIFLPSMRLARERLVWEAADGQLCTNTGFPLHRTSLPKLCAWKHTTGPRVSPKNRLHQWRKAERLSFTRKQEQQHKAEKFEEPAETTQNLPPHPSYHYALDSSSLLARSPQWSGTGLGNTEKERRGLKEPRLGIQRTWDSQSENKIFLEILYRVL